MFGASGITRPIQSLGCLLEVWVGLPGAPAGAQHEAQALLDTGASVSLIVPELARYLKLAPCGQIDAVVASVGVQRFPEHEISLAIRGPNFNLELPSLRVGACDFRGQTQISVLLGRDVLGLCTLLYDGIGGTFTLAG